MCLYINEKLTEKYHNKDVVIGYKYVDYCEDGLCAPHQYGKYHIGTNISTRESTELSNDEIRHNEVNKGFHVYLTLPLIVSLREQYNYHNSCGRKLIRVKCFKEDFVAAGSRRTDQLTKEAVYTKMYISEYEYNRKSKLWWIKEKVFTLLGLNKYFYDKG